MADGVAHAAARIDPGSSSPGSLQLPPELVVVLPSLLKELHSIELDGITTTPMFDAPDCPFEQFQMGLWDGVLTQHAVAMPTMPGRIQDDRQLVGLLRVGGANLAQRSAWLRISARRPSSSFVSTYVQDYLDYVAAVWPVDRVLVEVLGDEALELLSGLRSAPTRVGVLRQHQRVGSDHLDVSIYEMRVS